MSNPLAAVPQVVTVPVAAIKQHPVVWLVFFGLVAIGLYRYRTTIMGWLGGAPLIGDRATTFMR